MIRGAYENLVPSYISPQDFWSLSFSELPLIARNIRQKAWDEQYLTLYANRIHAQDISRVLAGKSFEMIERYMSPNPRNSKTRKMEDIELTLLQWAYQGAIDGEYS